MRKHLFLASLTAFLLVGLAAGGAVLLASHGDRAATPGPAADLHGTELASLRTVAVLPRRAAPVAPERQGLHATELVRLRAGALPRGLVTGTVLTDENCAPDPGGISHCSNDIALSTGETLSVVHDHAMAQVACLTPGERVRVRAA